METTLGLYQAHARDILHGMKVGVSTYVSVALLYQETWSVVGRKVTVRSGWFTKHTQGITCDGWRTIVGVSILVC